MALGEDFSDLDEKIMLPNSRTIGVGGLSKEHLREALHKQAIQINAFGELILADERFTTAKVGYQLELFEITVADLGFPKGSSLSTIYQRAVEQGLALCPIETGPHFRLQYLEQTEGEPSPQNQAPFGSLTIASELLCEDDDFPKGFYLRNIGGQLCLRGYTADDLHIWSPEDCFVFCQYKREGERR